MAPDLSRVPWRLVRRAFRRFREVWFGIDEPSGPAFLVTPRSGELLYEDTEELLDALEHAFGTYSYAPNWETSYHYYGEQLNLARVVYHETEEYPGVKWWQYHVRAFRHPDGRVRLRYHFETEPTENPDAHYVEDGFEFEQAHGAVEKVLVSHGFEYEHVEDLEPPEE